MVSSLRENNGLDLFNLKILGLLMCRGDIECKAGLLFDLIMQFNKEKNPKRRIIYWNHPRLKKAIRMLVYISEILPKKSTLLNQGDGLKISVENYTNMDEEIK